MNALSRLVRCASCIVFLSGAVSTAMAIDLYHPLQLRMVDAGSGQPVAHANLDYSSSTIPYRTPNYEVATTSLGGNRVFRTAFHSSIDDQGYTNLEANALVHDLVVRTDTQVGFLPAQHWMVQDGVVKLAMKPWASLRGSILSPNQHGAAPQLMLKRECRYAAENGKVVTYKAKVQHLCELPVDPAGHFAVSRLLPTGLDGEDMPYSIVQSFGQLSQASEKKPDLKEWVQPEALLEIQLAALTLQPGEHAEIQVAPLPVCWHKVTGSVRMSDASHTPAVLYFSPVLAEVSSLGWSRCQARVQPDGRFEVSLPISGQWEITAESSQNLTMPDGNASFTLPPGPDGEDHGPEVALGEIRVRTLKADEQPAK